jgi:hypothetical protein
VEDFYYKCTKSVYKSAFQFRGSITFLSPSKTGFRLNCINFHFLSHKERINKLAGPCTALIALFLKNNLKHRRRVREQVNSFFMLEQLLQVYTTGLKG